MNLTCYIADDEFHAIDILADYILRTPGLELAGSSVSALAALHEVTLTRPSVIFLDVDMPALNGLDFAALVNTFTRVIFTTSYREYAPEAFEKDAADYLLKPIGYERFLGSIHKLMRLNTSLPAQPVQEEVFFVKSGVKGNLTRIDLSDIVYVSGADNYVEFHLPGKKIIAYLTLGELEQRLSQALFSRIHKSYIISHKFIRSLEYAQVRLDGQVSLPVGRAYRQAFMQKMSGSYLVSKRDHAG